MATNPSMIELAVRDEKYGWWSTSRIGRALGRPAQGVWRKRRALGLPTASTVAMLRRYAAEVRAGRYTIPPADRSST